MLKIKIKCFWDGKHLSFWELFDTARVIQQPRFANLFSDTTTNCPKICTRSDLFSSHISTIEKWWQSSLNVLPFGFKIFNPAFLIKILTPFLWFQSCPWWNFFLKLKNECNGIMHFHQIAILIEKFLFYF